MAQSVPATSTSIRQQPSAVYSGGTLQIQLPEVDEHYACGDTYTGTVKRVMTANANGSTGGTLGFSLSGARAGSPQPGNPNNSTNGMAPTNVKHGTGRYSFADGSYYFGQWVDGRMEGKGVFFEASTGDQFDGIWRDGKRVQGVYRYANGDMYIGGFDPQTGCKKTGPAMVLDDCVLYKAIYKEDRLIKRDLILMPVHNSWETLMGTFGGANAINPNKYQDPNANLIYPARSTTARSPSPQRLAAAKRGSSPMGTTSRNAGTIILTPSRSHPAIGAATNAGAQTPNRSGILSPRATGRVLSGPNATGNGPVTSTVGAPRLRTTNRCESPDRQERYQQLLENMRTNPLPSTNGRVYEDVTDPSHPQAERMVYVDEAGQPIPTPKKSSLRSGSRSRVSAVHGADAPVSFAGELVAEEGTTESSPSTPIVPAGDANATAENTAAVDELPVDADGNQQQQQQPPTDASGRPLMTQEEALNAAKAVLRQRRDDLSSSQVNAPQAAVAKKAASTNNMSISVRTARSPTKSTNGSFGAFHQSLSNPPNYTSNSNMMVVGGGGRGMNASTTSLGLVSTASGRQVQQLTRNGSVVMPAPNNRSQTCRTLSSNTFGHLQRGHTEHVDDVSRQELQQAFRYYNTNRGGN